jgi:hypothetical protein
MSPGRVLYFENIEHGNNRRFLRALVVSLLSRAREGLACEAYAKRNHHQAMVDLLAPLEVELQEGGLPCEMRVPESDPLTALTESRGFLGKAETEIIVVDDGVDINTLDCLRDVRQHIKILTTLHANPLTDDFERALKEFKSEGHWIEVRRHPKLHDKFILFNDRCWLAVSSLKDVGEKTFSVIEIVDSKTLIYAEVTKKWEESIPLEIPLQGKE